MITVDEFLNPFMNEETGLFNNRIMILTGDGELIFDSNRDENDDCGIIELPIMESKVVSAYTNEFDGTLTVII